MDGKSNGTNSDNAISIQTMATRTMVTQKMVGRNMVAPNMVTPNMVTPNMVARNRVTPNMVTPYMVARNLVTPNMVMFNIGDIIYIFFFNLTSDESAFILMPIYHGNGHRRKVIDLLIYMILSFFRDQNLHHCSPHFRILQIIFFC